MKTTLRNLRFRGGPGEVVAVAASAAGIAISIYLTILHYAGVPPACPVSGPVNCEAVLASPYAVVGGSAIPTSAAGIVWFGVNLVLWLRPLGWPQLAWSAIGLLTVLYLVFIEIVQIGAICLWCTASHVLVLAVTLISVAMWSRGRNLAA